MAEVTAGELTGPQTHYDVIDDDEDSLLTDTLPDIIMDPHFEAALNYPAFEELLRQDRYRTMIRPSYEGEKYRFCGVSIGPAHLGVLVKTDRVIDIPLSVYYTFKESNALNKDVARRISRMQKALENPESAPWAPGQNPN